jgi:hypothetical protein
MRGTVLRAERPARRTSAPLMTLLHESEDPAGNPLALVVFRNRQWEYVPHAELGA